VLYSDFVLKNPFYELEMYTPCGLLASYELLTLLRREQAYPLRPFRPRFGAHVRQISETVMRCAAQCFSESHALAKKRPQCLCCNFRAEADRSVEAR
jgi:hypothetical protein